MSDYALPLEESSSRDGSDELDIEALVREAYEILKAKYVILSRLVYIKG